MLARALSSSSSGRTDTLRRVSSSTRSGGVISHHDVEAAYGADAGSIEEQPSEIERAASLAPSEVATSAPPRSPALSRRRLGASL